MRFSGVVALYLISGCANEEGSVIHVPELYPPVRSATPDGLVAAGLQAQGSPLLESDGGGLSDAAAPVVVDSQVDASNPVEADAASGNSYPYISDAGEFDAASPAVIDKLDAATTSDEDASQPPRADAASETAATTPAAPSLTSTTPPPSPAGSTEPPPPPGGTGAPPAPGVTGVAPVGSAPSDRSDSVPNPPGTPSEEPAAIGLSTAVQQRFYSGGPTDLLRIIKSIDTRLGELTLDPVKHPCLESKPVSSAFALPSGELFEVQLQCQQSTGNGDRAQWLAFGIDNTSGNSAQGDFYFAEGRPSGMGGAYRVDGVSGDIEGWIAVADKDAPANSQVIIHLLLHKETNTVELAFAGSGVGFCGAHLKTNSAAIFVTGSQSGPAAEGRQMSNGDEYCKPVETGCFRASDLSSELDAASELCATIDANSFRLGPDLNATVSGNVTPSTIYKYFATAPIGVPAF